MSLADQPARTNRVDKPGRVPPGRRSTPRPAFDAPQHLRRTDMAHHVWGDKTAGFVTDRVISSTGQLHALEYELPPRSEFRHSDVNPTVFGGDVLYFVAEGTLVLANPATGEIARAEAGSGLLFHAGTWHNGFNPFAVTTRVVEFFSPPPARGAASEYGRRQPPLASSTYADDRWAGRWPEASAERDASRTLIPVGPGNALVTFRDVDPGHLVTVLVDTAFLRVVEGAVQPGHVEDFQIVEHESVLVATRGQFWVDVWSEAHGYAATSVLGVGEAMFLPAGCLERTLNRGSEEARYLQGSGHVPDGWVA